MNHHHHQFILRQKINMQMFYTSSNNNGRLPEEPNGLMNWPPIMKIKILQLTVHVLGLQNKNKWKEETLGPKQSYNMF